MKKERGGVVILTLLTAAAILCGNGLWLLELAHGHEEPMVIWGAVIGIVGMVFLLALVFAYRRWMEKEREERQMEMDALETAHQQELQQTRTKAKQEMESFRSALSHSLRMPVAIIQGYAELLAGNMVADPKVQREYLEKIVQRSQYMTEIMSHHFSADEVMDSSKLSYSEIDLLDMVRQAAGDMQTAAKEKSVVIQVVSSEVALPMVADAYLLNRALFNLLENALKYMGRPGVITIRVLRLGNNVSILVQDDGIGLAANETDHIFEPYYQGSNRSGGHGYGLYLVKQAAEAHGGTVSAQSALGRGMGVMMTIPLKPKQ